jgi:HK97 gp10 family phage protein
MSISIRGLPQLRAKLARVRAEIELASPAATRAGGEVVARAMIIRAPKDTGYSASRIRVLETTSLGDGASSSVGTDAEYDRFVQKGTVYMAAQPYGEESADEVTAALVTAMASIYKAAIH